MKSRLKILTLIACGASCAFIQSSLAQSPSPSPQEHHGKGPQGDRHGDRLEMLTKALGLTADQQAAIKPILETEREAMKAAHDTANAAIEGLLTDEQKAKLAKLKAEHPHGPGGPGGGPRGPGEPHHD